MGIINKIEQQKQEHQKLHKKPPVYMVLTPEEINELRKDIINTAEWEDLWLTRKRLSKLIGVTVLFAEEVTFIDKRW